MKNLIRLVKINLLTFFDFNKILKAKNKKEAIRAIPKAGLILFAFGYFGYMIYSMAKFILQGLLMMNIANLLLPLFMAILSIYLLFTTIFRVNKTIFNAKDYNILLSLPIRKTTIISSKLIVLYTSNLIYSLVFMIPSYIAYINYVDVNIIFHVFYFISLLFIPIVPTVIGSLIGTALTGVSSRFKHKNIVSMIFSFILIFGVMILSYQTNNINFEVVANISNKVMGYFNSYYPLTKIYFGVIENKILSLIIFISISILLFEGYKYLIVNFFDKINSNLKSVTIINKYNDSKVNISSGFISLYKKEIKKYFSNPMYVLNTGIGSMLLIIMVIAYAVMGGEKVEVLLEMKGLSDAVALYGPVVFGAFCALSCTTYPSISLEGKNLWILKSLPINIKEIFMSKIFVNLTILFPMIIISSIVLTITLHLKLITFLLLLFTPLMYSIFIAALGLLINLIFPDFNWNNEIKVIKQSVASFITVFLGMIIAIVPVTISSNYNPTLFSFIVGLIMMLLNVILYFILFTYGKSKFEKLLI